jgi:hypothetical protein
MMPSYFMVLGFNLRAGQQCACLSLGLCDFYDPSLAGWILRTTLADCAGIFCLCFELYTRANPQRKAYPAAAHMRRPWGANSQRGIHTIALLRPSRCMCSPSNNIAASCLSAICFHSQLMSPR